MILGFLVVTSVLIVSLGRLGDMYGRVQMYNLGFVIYTVASLVLTVDWMNGRAGRDLPDRLPDRAGGRRRLPARQLGRDHHRRVPRQPARAWRSGSTTSSASAACSSGLVLGGLLAPIDWRLVFLISVPVGLFGTVWAYLKLEERSTPKRARVDWWGNITFALGLILIMVSVTYGIRPYGSHATGLGQPAVLGLLGAGVGVPGRVRDRSSGASPSRCSACRCFASARSRSGRSRRSCPRSRAAG